MSLENPKVSVVMPVYNGEKYVGEAIKSILNQTFTDFEFLIIDDGSTDHSVEIIKSYKDNRIRLLQNPTNYGIVYSRNKGISEAKGVYVAMFDCDDISCSSRLQEQVNFLDINSDFGMVGAGISIIDSKNNLTGNEYICKAPSEKIPSLLLFSNCFAQSSVMVRKNLLKLECYRESYRLAEDYDLWVRLSYITKMCNLPKVLILYRVHGNNTSCKNGQLMDLYACNIIRYQLNKLGITPSESQISIHKLQGISNSISNNKMLIGEILSWLLRLDAANSQYNIYNSFYFKQVLTEQWLYACKKVFIL